MRKQILTVLALVLAAALTACGPAPTRDQMDRSSWLGLCGFAAPTTASERELLKSAGEQCLATYQSELTAAEAAVTKAAGSKELQTNSDARNALANARKLRNIAVTQVNRVLQLKQKFFEPLAVNLPPQKQS